MIKTIILKEIIKESGYKLSYIASKLGISRYSLSNKINNVTEFTQSEIVKISKLLKINTDDISNIFFYD